MQMGKRAVPAVPFILMVLIGAIPASQITTPLLTPVWRYAEERLGVEAIGPSGPADWCFIVMYVLCLVACGAFWWTLLRAGRRHTT
jgi:hypothetical protein